MVDIDADDRVPTPSDWPTCTHRSGEADSPCNGRQVDGFDHCLAHLEPEQLDQCFATARSGCRPGRPRHEHQRRIARTYPPRSGKQERASHVRQRQPCPGALHRGCFVRNGPVQRGRRVRRCPVQRGRRVRRCPVQRGRRVRPCPVQRGRRVRRCPVQRERRVRRCPVQRGRRVRRCPVQRVRRVRRCPVQRGRQVRRCPVQRDRRVRRCPVQRARRVRRCPVQRGRQVRRCPVQRDAPWFGGAQFSGDACSAVPSSAGTPGSTVPSSADGRRVRRCPVRRETPSSRCKVREGDIARAAGGWQPLLQRAVFVRPVVLEAAAVSVTCTDTTWEAGVTMRLRYARVDLERATFTVPSFVAGADQPFELPSRRLDPTTWTRARSCTRVSEESRVPDDLVGARPVVAAGRGCLQSFRYRC